MNSYRRISLVTSASLSRVVTGSLLCFFFLLAGCAQKMPAWQPVAAPDSIEPVEPEAPLRADVVQECAELQTANLNQALSEVNETLRLPHCRERAEHYFQDLLRIAEQAPDAQNRQRFSQLFSQLDNAGVISRMQATTWFTQYFSTSFMALPDSHNVCSARRQQDNILASMRDELRLKERGLLNILGDREQFFKARQRHDDISLILQTAIMACQDYS